MKHSIKTLPKFLKDKEFESYKKVSNISEIGMNTEYFIIKYKVILGVHIGINKLTQIEIKNNRVYIKK